MKEIALLTVHESISPFATGGSLCQSDIARYPLPGRRALPRRGTIRTAASPGVTITLRISEILEI